VTEERFDRRGVDAEVAEELTEFADFVRENDIGFELRRVLGKSERIGERQTARFADELGEELRQPRNDFHPRMLSRAVVANDTRQSSRSSRLGHQDRSLTRLTAASEYRKRSGRGDQRPGWLRYHSHVVWSPARVVDMIAGALTGFAILLGCFFLLSISHGRAFQVDEVEHLHAAYDLRDGRMIYRDFWQGHPPLIYALLVPLTDIRDPIGTYQRARILFAAILMSTIALSSLCAWKLAGGWAGAIAGGLALFHTTLIERGIEVRPDGPLALLIVAALAVELTDWKPKIRYSIEALLLGAGILLTQKAVFPLAVFGALWLITAWRERRGAWVAQPLLLSLVPLGVTVAFMAAAGCAGLFFRYVFLSAASAGLRSETRGTFGPLLFIGREGARNIAFLLIAFAAMAWLTIRRHHDRRVIFTLLLAFGLAASLWANPFPWPYTHVTVIPLLAVISGVGAALAASRSVVAPVAAIAIVLTAVTAIPRLTQVSARSAGLQFATLREVGRLIPPKATVFDLAGLYFRPDAYSVYAMSADMLVTYRNGQFPRIVPELRKNAVACVLYNYRTALLPPTEKAFIGAHFTHYGGNIFLPGADLSAIGEGASIGFEALAPARFRYEGGGAIVVDGAPFVEGALTRGIHRISVVRAARGSHLMVSAPPPLVPGPGTLFEPFD
jgi:hypothetical protein